MKIGLIVYCKSVHMFELCTFDYRYVSI